MITCFSPEYQNTCYGCGVEMGGHPDPDAQIRDSEGNWWNTACYQDNQKHKHDYIIADWNNAEECEGQ